MSEMSPNLLDLDRFAVEVKKIDKPWGYEVVFAATERYCGKVIFVRAGHHLSCSLKAAAHALSRTP